jgi:hypothetical protein
MTRDAAHHGQSHVLARFVVRGAAGIHGVKQSGFKARFDPDFFANAQFDRVSFFYLIPY